MLGSGSGGWPSNSHLMLLTAYSHTAELVLWLPALCWTEMSIARSPQIVRYCTRTTVVSMAG